MAKHRRNLDQYVRSCPILRQLHYIDVYQTMAQNDEDNGVDDVFNFFYFICSCRCLVR